MKFYRQNYNEFKSWVRWHDYVSILINEFPLLLARRYDWMGDEKSTFSFYVAGFKIYQKIWSW